MDKQRELDRSLRDVLHCQGQAELSPVLLRWQLTHLGAAPLPFARSQVVSLTGVNARTRASVS
jgi:hypothetical protein